MKLKWYFRLIGQSIRLHRTKSGMTLPQLADKAGIAKGNLSKIENHPCNISLETLYRLSEALQIPVKDFLP